MDDMKDEVFPPLPPPTSPGQGARGSFDNEDEDGDADMSQLADVPAAKRKGVKRPQPKLDSQRLISERGLPALRTLFDDVRFKGKGHEPEDLRLLMQKMENWAHRLYPKLQFEDFIDKVEKLGSKKDVQTCLKRIRMDMPLTHEGFMGGEEEEEEAAPESRVFGDPDPFNSSSFIDLPAPGRSTPALGRSPLPPPSLTEEQQQRMEMNRQRALERRLTRQQQTDSQTVDSSSFVSPANDSQVPEEAEALDPEPASSSQEPGQLPHADPEPLRDEEEEPFLRGESEDGDQRSESGS